MDTEKRHAQFLDGAAVDWNMPIRSLQVSARKIKDQAIGIRGARGGWNHRSADGDRDGKTIGPRTYVNVADGCGGGRHRSSWLRLRHRRDVRLLGEALRDETLRGAEANQ